MMHEESWPNDQLQRLKTLCLDKNRYSALDMAGILNQEFPYRPKNFTRNSVIGKIHRNKIPWIRELGKRDAAPSLGANDHCGRVQHRNSPSTRTFSGQNANYDPRRKERNSINKITQKSRKVSQFAGLIGSDALWAGKGIALDGAPPTACRWPLQDQFGRHSRCCGEPRYNDVYCEGHYVIAKIVSSRQQPKFSQETPRVEHVDG